MEKHTKDDLIKFRCTTEYKDKLKEYVKNNNDDVKNNSDLIRKALDMYMSRDINTKLMEALFSIYDYRRVEKEQLRSPSCIPNLMKKFTWEEIEELRNEYNEEYSKLAASVEEARKEIIEYATTGKLTRK